MRRKYFWIGGVVLLAVIVVLILHNAQLTIPASGAQQERFQCYAPEVNVSMSEEEIRQAVETHVGSGEILEAEKVGEKIYITYIPNSDKAHWVTLIYDDQGLLQMAVYDERLDLAYSQTREKAEFYTNFRYGGN